MHGGTTSHHIPPNSQAKRQVRRKSLHHIAKLIITALTTSSHWTCGTAGTDTFTLMVLGFVHCAELLCNGTWTCVDNPATYFWLLNSETEQHPHDTQKLGWEYTTTRCPTDVSRCITICCLPGHVQLWQHKKHTVCTTHV